MHKTAIIKLEFDKVLFVLFCAYAFSMPFELAFEILLDVKTIFKPFRILSLIIIGVFAIKVLMKGFYLPPNIRTDLLLYAVFVYGFIVSAFKIIVGVFDMNLFINDAFQFSLHVLTFFIFKCLPLEKKQALQILKWFVLGISLNAFYITYKIFFLLGWGRESGFTDNPNYAAFGLVAATTLLILRTNFTQKNIYHLGSLSLVLLLLFAFGTEGSRTGFIMFLIANFFIFFFSPLRRKIVLFFVSTLLVLLLIPNILGKFQYNGPSVLINRLNKKAKDDTEDVRFVVWRGVFRTLETEGYGGMGIGQFKAKFPQYFGQESNRLLLSMVNYGYYLSPHNDYLAIVADYGLPSLLFYLGFLVVSLWRLFRQVNYPKEDDEANFLAQFNFIFFICIIIFGMAAENFQHQLYWFLLMFTTKRLT